MPFWAEHTTVNETILKNSNTTPAYSNPLNNMNIVELIISCNPNIVNPYIKLLPLGFFTFEVFFILRCLFMFEVVFINLSVAMRRKVQNSYLEKWGARTTAYRAQESWFGGKEAEAEFIFCFGFAKTEYLILDFTSTEDDISKIDFNFLWKEATIIRLSVLYMYAVLYMM